MIKCRNSGSPATSSVSATIARSRSPCPLPANQRWLPSHVASASSIAIGLDPSSSQAPRKRALFFLPSILADPPEGDDRKEPGPYNTNDSSVMFLPRRRELKPVEAVTRQGQQVRQLPDPREHDAAHALHGRYTHEPAEVKLDWLRKA